jgi:hypothetical protein
LNRNESCDVSGAEMELNGSKRRLTAGIEEEQDELDAVHSYMLLHIHVLYHSYEKTCANY